MVPIRMMGSDRDGIKAGGGRARGGRVSGRCGRSSNREGHQARGWNIHCTIEMRVAAAILIRMGGIVRRTDGIVSVDWCGEYRYNDDVS